MRFFMKKSDKNKPNFDPNGSYTGKYIKENSGNTVVLTPPEQDADDL